MKTTKKTDFIYSQQFLKIYWDQLVEIDIPMFVLDDVKNWCYLIEHGDILPIFNFSLKDLSILSLKKLNEICKSYSDSLSQNIENIIETK